MENKSELLVMNREAFSYFLKEELISFDEDILKRYKSFHFFINDDDIDSDWAVFGICKDLLGHFSLFVIIDDNLDFNVGFEADERCFCKLLYLLDEKNLKGNIYPLGSQYLGRFTFFLFLDKYLVTDFDKVYKILDI